VPQEAVWPLQFPVLADADTLYVPATGVFQLPGGFVKVKPLESVASLHFTVGWVIATPAVPVVEAKLQVSVYVTALELLAILLELLAIRLLLLASLLELLGTALLLLTVLLGQLTS